MSTSAGYPPPTACPSCGAKLSHTETHSRVWPPVVGVEDTHFAAYACKTVFIRPDSHTTWTAFSSEPGGCRKPSAEVSSTPITDNLMQGTGTIEAVRRLELRLNEQASRLSALEREYCRLPEDGHQAPELRPNVEVKLTAIQELAKAPQGLDHDKVKAALG